MTNENHRNDRFNISPRSQYPHNFRGFFFQSFLGFCFWYRSHTIHGTGIFTYIYPVVGFFLLVNVGKYTSLMDGIEVVSACIKQKMSGFHLAWIANSRPKAQRRSTERQTWRTGCWTTRPAAGMSPPLLKTQPETRHKRKGKIIWTKKPPFLGPQYP